MELILKNALQDLVQIRNYSSEMEESDFEESFNLIFNNLSNLNSAELIEILYETLTALNDSNFEAHFTVGIPGSILAYVLEEKLLSVEEAAMTMTQLSVHFTTVATQWINLVYHDQYLKYAYRFTYSIEEIDKGIKRCPVESIKGFLLILQEINEPPQYVKPFAEKINDIIRQIEKQILPTLEK